MSIAFCHDFLFCTNHEDGCSRSISVDLAHALEAPTPWYKADIHTSAWDVCGFAHRPVVVSLYGRRHFFVTVGQIVMDEEDILAEAKRVVDWRPSFSPSRDFAHMSLPLLEECRPQISYL